MGMVGIENGNRIEGNRELRKHEIAVADTVTWDPHGLFLFLLKMEELRPFEKFV